jgi:hypothetical protein
MLVGTRSPVDTISGPSGGRSRRWQQWCSDLSSPAPSRRVRACSPYAKRQRDDPSVQTQGTRRYLNLDDRSHLRLCPRLSDLERRQQVAIGATATLTPSTISSCTSSRRSDSSVPTGQWPSAPPIVERTLEREGGCQITRPGYGHPTVMVFAVLVAGVVTAVCATSLRCALRGHRRTGRAPVVHPFESPERLER